ncbi:MAG: IS1096 element passenger TnpR family protein [Lentihominibacter sp.]
MSNGTILDLDEYRKKGSLSPVVGEAEFSDFEVDDSESRSIWNLTSNYDVLKLKLELVNHYETPEDNKTLKKYGKVEHGIIREVLVPGQMTLHAIHYMIQKLFGWQNSHLRHFELPERIFKGLTNNNAKSWSELCGVYFRFPEGEEYSDIYWDDDYDENVSVKTWLKRKYNDGNWETFSVGDSYLDNVRKVEDFEEWLNTDERGKKIFEGKSLNELSIEDLMKVADIGIDADHLIERLEIGELLYVKGKGEKREDLKCCREAIDYLISDFKDILDNELDIDELEYMKDSAQTLRRFRSNWQELEKYINCHPGEARKELGQDPQEALFEYKLAINSLELQCLEYINDWSPEIVPVTDELMYMYDYGDGWEVRISCEEGYYAEWENDEIDYDSASHDEIMEHILTTDEDMLFFDSNDEKVSEEMFNVLEEIQYLQKPCCVSADGLNVMDDVGGVGGYIDFLNTIHGIDKEEAKSYREWARGMGWTGRRSKPENML